MGDSVGQEGLDLVLNKGEFESGLNSITKLATNAGKMLAGAFAVGKLISFGKAISLIRSLCYKKGY